MNETEGKFKLFRAQRGGAHSITPPTLQNSVMNCSHPPLYKVGYASFTFLWRIFERNCWSLSTTSSFILTFLLRSSTTVLIYSTSRLAWPLAPNSSSILKSQTLTSRLLTINFAKASSNSCLSWMSYALIGIGISHSWKMRLAPLFVE